MAGVASSLGLILYSRGLATGPAAIVVPVFNAYAFITVLLSISFLKERLRPMQTLAILGIIGGVILLRI
uniref:EamA-like transporter family protein n=1 Tax=Candidatus Kentrum sp. TC TaxID=2126339 RepID=A0A450Z685_9GAMM|nr:MAG: EamA-like transporter family protein [Candidatus Kentron sp. TC]